MRLSESKSSSTAAMVIRAAVAGMSQRPFVMSSMEVSFVSGTKPNTSRRQWAATMSIIAKIMKSGSTHNVTTKASMRSMV